MANPKVRSHTRKVALLNQKGGTGKSTTVLGVACAAAELGARVLIRDMDPQANVTIALAPEEVTYTMNDVLRPDEGTGEVVEGCLASAIRPAGSSWPRGVYVVPATLTQSERETDQAVGREQRLQVTSQGVTDAFDLVLDDCPPSIGQLTVNALTDDDDALIVTTPEFWAIQGTHQARRTIRRVAKYYNPRLRFAGILVNNFKVGRVESTQRLEELHASYPGEVWSEVFPELEVVRKAIGAISPLAAYGREAENARARYRTIAQHLLSEDEEIPHGPALAGAGADAR